MDLSSLSVAELRRLQTKVETEIRRRSDTAKKDLLKRMQKLAAEHGMSLTDVIGGQEATEKAAPAPKKAAAKPAAKKAAKPASVIKFRHPENAAIGWTGHGRKPQWVIDWVAQGKSLDDLRADAASVTAA